MGSHLAVGAFGDSKDPSGADGGRDMREDEELASYRDGHGLERYLGEGGSKSWWPVGAGDTGRGQW